jgi:CRISPR-associated protein Cas1
LVRQGYLDECSDIIETESMDQHDSLWTENYNLRLRPSGAHIVKDEVNAWFNSSVEYLGKNTAWSYVLFLKTRDLAHYLVGKKKTIPNFSTPEYHIERQDSEEVRRKILSISYADWKKMGFSKGTLHYLKQNAVGKRPFTMNQHVRERLKKW